MSVNLLDFLPDSYSVDLTNEEVFYAELCCLTGTDRYDWGFADEDGNHLGFYYSEVYKNVWGKIHHIVDAVPEWFPAYCTTKKKKKRAKRKREPYRRQTYCVAFAISYGLSERECILIADERNVEFAIYILDEFFCGTKSYEEVVAILQMGEKSIEERIELLYSPYHECEVELKFHDGRIVKSAQKKGDWVIDDENHKRYKITE